MCCRIRPGSSYRGKTPRYLSKQPAESPVPFGDWSWVVPCVELRDYLRGAHSIRTSALPRTSWLTLASFLKGIKECRPVRRAPVDTSANELGDTESLSGRESRNRDTLMAVFIPKEDLPNWDEGV